jgi:hypothetical protein
VCQGLTFNEPRLGRLALLVFLYDGNRALDTHRQPSTDRFGQTHLEQCLDALSCRTIMKHVVNKVVHSFL